MLAINVNMQATDVETLFSTNVASLLSMIFNFVFFDALQKHEAFTAKITQMLLFSVFWVISFDVISQVEKIRILITTIKTELELAFRMYLHIVSFLFVQIFPFTVTKFTSFNHLRTCGS